MECSGLNHTGGVILQSWFDRTLKLAGRIVVRDHGKLTSHLVDFSKSPLITIPSLAIHLKQEVNNERIINSQTDLPAILGLGELNEVTFNLLLRQDFSKSTEIMSFDLSLCNCEEGMIIGENDKFIHTGKLDDLACAYASLTALVNVPNPATTTIVALWDNEEVGSNSAQGANGSFLKDVTKRLADTSNETLKVALAKSFLISADAAHAIHPNYMSKHDSHHAPLIGKGIVIKENSNLRYATNALSSAIFKDICDEAGVHYQSFSSRCDIACGSTIGPIVATKLGIPTVDIGAPMLAMHSIREMMGVQDQHDIMKAFTTFFERGREEVVSWT